MMVVALIASYAAWQAHTTADNTTRALCALKLDLETRLASGAKFLVAHPHGIPGISAGVIQTGLSGEQRTIQALRFIDC